MRYTITRNGNKVGTATNLDRAINAAEQSFQCGIEETKAEIRNNLKASGWAYVTHCLDDSLIIKIEAA